MTTVLTKRKARRILHKKLQERVYDSIYTQYHTSNPPPWNGYIVMDADMVAVRRLLGMLERLEVKPKRARRRDSANKQH